MIFFDVLMRIRRLSEQTSPFGPAGAHGAACCGRRREDGGAVSGNEDGRWNGARRGGTVRRSPVGSNAAADHVSDGAPCGMVAFINVGDGVEIEVGLEHAECNDAATRPHFCGPRMFYAAKGRKSLSSGRAEDRLCQAGLTACDQPNVRFTHFGYAPMESALVHLVDRHDKGAL